MSAPQASPESASVIVPCPRCQTPAVFARSNLWRPFCSERCKSGDLGAWASGEYALPAAPDDPDDLDGVDDAGVAPYTSH